MFSNAFVCDFKKFLLIFTQLVLVTWLSYIRYMGRFMVSEQDLVYQIRPNIVIKTVALQTAKFIRRGSLQGSEPIEE